MEKGEFRRENGISARLLFKDHVAGVIIAADIMLMSASKHGRKRSLSLTISVGGLLLIRQANV
jgi:hypothetical protein